MTVPRLTEIVAYWSRVPPLHEAFAGFIGALNTKSGAAPTSGTTGAVGSPDDLMKDLAGLGFTMPTDTG